MAWRFLSSYGLAPTAGSETDFEGDARKALIDLLNEVSALEPEVKVNLMVIEGHPAEVLVRAAEDADLLAVGSRGHGPFTSAMIGSVSISCVLHSHCPVLVVRDGHDGPGDDELA